MFSKKFSLLILSIGVITAAALAAGTVTLSRRLTNLEDRPPVIEVQRVVVPTASPSASIVLSPTPKTVNQIGTPVSVTKGVSR